MEEEIRTAMHFDQLTKRRGRLVLTLQHIRKEQTEAEQNTDWLDQAAYENRTHFLDRLNEWCLEEMNQIDRALDRIDHHEYGECLACHQPIEPVRLKTAPEAEFCSACQSMRDAIGHG